MLNSRLRFFYESLFDWTKITIMPKNEFFSLWLWIGNILQLLVLLTHYSNNDPSSPHQQRHRHSTNIFSLVLYDVSTPCSGSCSTAWCLWMTVFTFPHCLENHQIGNPRHFLYDRTTRHHKYRIWSCLAKCTVL